MVRISNATEQFVKRNYPNLEREMRLAQMKPDVAGFFKKVILLSLVFTLIIGVIAFLLLAKTDYLYMIIVVLAIFFLIFFILFIRIPKYNIEKIRKEIEGDIFIPARMLLTLLESGNSIVSALEGVSYTKANSSKYFGKISSRIYLGMNIKEAIDEAIKYTPSESFKRVLDPIRRSLKTGTDIQSRLKTTLQDLANEKIVEIERYEKKLGALSLFYMIFGTIIPAVGIVVLVVIFSVMGLKIEFFPFLFIAILIILIVQVIFIRSFKGIRPLMRL